MIRKARVMSGTLAAKTSAAGVSRTPLISCPMRSSTSPNKSSTVDMSDFMTQTSPNTHTHKHTIKWAGSRVRKRDANTTHSDMLLAVWENMILEEIGRKHKVRPRTWTPRASPSGSVRHTRPMDVVCRRSPRNFVHSAIPITWAEACSLASAAFGTAGERARRAVTQERQHLLTLNWHWSARCTAFRAGRDNVFVPGDVVRFRGSESLPNSPPTALVAEVSASPPPTHTHQMGSRDIQDHISRCDPGYLEM